MLPISNYYGKFEAKKEKNENNRSEKPVNVTSDTNVGQTITIQGVRIDFPVKPYAAQIQMMNNIISALNKKENALLESPTGSGKSLALLCAALAWREKQEQIAAVEIKNKKAPKKTEPAVKKTVKTRVKVIQSAVDDDFQQPIAKRFIGEVIEEKPVEEKLATLDEVKKLKYDTFKEVPRIFIGSRTHKQIAQLVSELKTKTRYRPRTTVLGSREHLCIHPKVKESFKKTEDCTELLEKDKCRYAKRTNTLLSHSSLKTTNRVWDIEDMVSLGKATKGCPYYAARKLYEGAEVIFCPYNYIIDPVIRTILDINLKQSIVILDEAHNVEDASRSAGSFVLDEHALDPVIKELSTIAKYGGERDAHRTLEFILGKLLELMVSNNTIYTHKEYEKQSCHFTGQDLLKQLKDIHITKNTYEVDLLPAYKKVSAHADLIRKEFENRAVDRSSQHELENEANGVRVKRVKCLSNGSLTILQNIFVVLGFLCNSDHDYSKDYEMVLMKTVDRGNDAPVNKRRKTVHQTMTRSIWTHKLAFWCLNPAVIFRNMCETTHSVILASGTLSPLNTFASELGTKFTGRLEANHVINPSQVWVNAIPFGPNKVALKGIYSNIESLQYQDEVGDVLCDIIETVPYGVLCFMPSYKALDIMIERWKLTGVMDRIDKTKLVCTEPRGKDKKEFESIMDKFYEKIQLVECGIDEQGRNGALLFAVFRGKVSEGIDFTDNNCRAVITLGIPYPGVKDLEITLKRDYNNRIKNESKDTNVLSGNDWYSAQAYRAINQALGRCIRHKNDWGAIILLEERFTKPENVNGLSKWVKGHLKVEYDYKAAMSSLDGFVKSQLKEMEKTKQENALVTSSTPNQLEDAMLTTNTPAEVIDLENGFPHVINLDDSFTEDKISNSQEDHCFKPPLPLQSIENNVFTEPSPIERVKNDTSPLKPDIPFNSNCTQLSCTRCHHELLRGPVEYIKPIPIHDLTCIADQTKHSGLVMQLEHPAIWETSDRLQGGPLEISELPTSNTVIYNIEDGICYKQLRCLCNKNAVIGILVCIATMESKKQHVGNVYLFETMIRTVMSKISKEDIENEIPNSQYFSVDDIFFNL